MLKAISSPTVIVPSITDSAPMNRISAVVTLLTYWIRFWPERAEHAGVERGADIGREPLLPLRLHHRLDARRLQRLRADDRFDQELLRTGAAIELLVDLLAQDRPDQRGDDDVERDGAEHDQRQLRRIDEHHDEEDEREDEIEQRGQALAGQEAADRLEFAHARHRLARRRASRNRTSGSRNR